ncbi:hypothetical protein [Grimontia marina]|uniref:hypothetical protein n=1 Tax=Grimontia marina TaxID=646534 RepID=UPI0018DDCB86|nr:hypothetical protein [Grimontia marina]
MALSIALTTFIAVRKPLPRLAKGFLLRSGVIQIFLDANTIEYKLLILVLKTHAASLEEGKALNDFGAKLSYATALRFSARNMPLLSKSFYVNVP